MRALLKAEAFKTFEVSMSMHAAARARVCKRLRAAVAETYNSVTDAFDAVPEDAHILLEGGGEPALYDTDTTMGTFQQESNFQYLLGVKEPGCWAAVRVSDARTTLYVPRLPAEYAVEEVRFVDELLDAPVAVCSRVYVLSGLNTDSGRSIRPPRLKALTSADGLLESGDDAKGDDAKGDDAKNSADAQTRRDARVATSAAVEARFDVGALYPVVSECRAIKSREEIALMRYVTDVTSDAHLAVMARAAPGMKEYQLESLFRHYCYYVGGCRHMAYTCICASAYNGATLHYGHAGEPNAGVLRRGRGAGGTEHDMCLFDMGAEFHRYASDVTCSFPAGGRFDGDQRGVYEGVLKAQQAVMDAMRPGVSWVDMHELACREILTQLRDVVGVVRRDAALDAMMAADLGAVFMPHGLGHFIGLNVHDVGGYDPRPSPTERTNGEGGRPAKRRRRAGPVYPPRPARPGFRSLRTARVLAEGMCLTVEPGCYFNDFCLDRALQDPTQSAFLVPERLADFRGFGGVRLEDCVVVTHDGIENLTNCPRTVADVEAVMAGRITERSQLQSFHYRRSSGPESEAGTSSGEAAALSDRARRGGGGASKA
jgi:Xaa-Pro dipeptidase